ncbi:MAG: tRNA (adenosine(37)-N6)-dimethylallyltransferase MiaA [Pseudomonadota bacterium]
MTNALQKIIIICGPTASGKTRVGVELARKFDGEIVSADSGAVWRGFDIGTAKAALTEQGDVPHHLIDVAIPGEHFDASRFVALADAAIADIRARGRVPFIVGGTGMYIRMLVHGICDAPPRDPDFRAELDAEMEKHGAPMLHERLSAVDAGSAARLHPNDRARIVRALEIHHLTGMSATAIRKCHGFKERRYDALKIGLKVDRAELYRRIDERVNRMIGGGLVEEVRSLISHHDSASQPFSAVGYREIAAYLKGEMDLKEAVLLMKKNSRHFAKRQMTWFSADPEIMWFDPERRDDIVGEVERFLC